jgi:hypothetical protein
MNLQQHLIRVSLEYLSRKRTAHTLKAILFSTGWFKFSARTPDEHAGQNCRDIQLASLSLSSPLGETDLVKHPFCPKGVYPQCILAALDNLEPVWAHKRVEVALLVAIATVALPR